MTTIDINIDIERLPKHIAIIMDGNGRWAKRRNQPRVFGHRQGAKSVRKVVEGAARLGVNNLTLYAFSTENWNRPKYEIKTLMKLLISALKNELGLMMKNNIRLNTIGHTTMMPNNVQQELQEVLDETKKNTGLVLTLALSYGARQEILRAVQEISYKVKNNIISIENVDDNIINKHLYTQNLPDVDLLIRTSGEVRISNFLLWQIAYAELYFTDELWPDFNETSLHKAIADYQKRERRFGKTSEQVT
ncbi:MAG: isoprenyl transferase [Bacteroidota bacterium]|nr:isoprenyl transferase [Bacteroidota bacterium]MEC8637366.1 isoprenyl transferase [Bacteroidota bacterium]